MKILKHLSIVLASMLTVSCANFNAYNETVFEDESSTEVSETQKVLKKDSSATVKPALKLKKNIVKSATAKKSNGKLLSKQNISISYNEKGYASFYDEYFHGKKTANGGIYNKHEYTAAHRDLPLPSVVEVTNLKNRKTILVVVNDRGPYHNIEGDKARIIDLSPKAAKALEMIDDGVVQVQVKYLHEETKKLTAKFPEKKKANLALQSALTKYIAHVNASKIARS